MKFEMINISKVNYTSMLLYSFTTNVDTNRPTVLGF